jgi:hypothetical protein
MTRRERPLLNHMLLFLRSNYNAHFSQFAGMYFVLAGREMKLGLHEDMLQT